MVSSLAAGATIGGLVLAGAVGFGAPPTEIASAQPPDPPAHDHGDHDHASTLDDEGRFTGPGEVWPPQVRGATDVVELDLSELAAPSAVPTLSPDASDRAMVGDLGPVEIATASDEVRAAIGGRYNLISVTDSEVVPGSEKGDENERATLVIYFSLDRGQTVEVFVAGGQVLKVTSYPAGDRQPPLSAKEKFRAVELARAHWSVAGDARLPLLEGFAILAVQPDGTYYGSRMAYVSFHVDDASDPELLTWVDLTSETILNAKVDR